MIGCIIQARLDSTRLPNKVLTNIDNENPVLFFVVEQLKNCELIEDIVVATSDEPKDDKIIDFCKKYKIKYFRGNNKNVLDRYFQCAKTFDYSIIIRIPADKPLIDPEIVDMCIEKFLKNEYDCITNFKPLTFPSGTEVEIFSMKTLEFTWKNAMLPSEKEHVTPYIYKNENKFKIFNIKNTVDQSNYRWAVDYKEDLELIRKIVSKIKNRPILTRHIIELLTMEKELVNINKDVLRNEGNIKSTKEDEIFLRKNKKENN